MLLKEPRIVNKGFSWKRWINTTAASVNEQSLFYDRSLWFLLLANGITTILAVTQNWNLLALMWVYWFQNLVIGFFHYRRILGLVEFYSTKGFTIDHRPVESTEEGKYRVARFFLGHYGFAHFCYFVVLVVFSQSGGLSPLDLIYIIPTALLFLGNHIYSYRYNKPRVIGKQNLFTMMKYPYARVVPMHLTIILGFAFDWGLLLFLLLKTLADVIMHVVEHRVLLKGKARQT